MKSTEYQYNFSDIYDDAYDVKRKKMKGEKIISVLADYYGGNDSLGYKKLLDVGCSTGVQTSILSEYFAESIGIDIDEKAILNAKQNYCESNRLKYAVDDCLNMAFEDSSFDVVICSHIYEHIPAPKRLMSEINRVLVVGGVCYFAAASKWQLIEPHYRLPLLSWIPKPMANVYVRLTGKSKKYYENLLSHKRLTSLTTEFERKDYTMEIIRNPEKYNATDMLKSDTIYQKIAIFVCEYLYRIVPTYIWILLKC